MDTIAQLEQLARRLDSVATLTLEGGLTITGHIAGVDEARTNVRTNLGLYGDPGYRNLPTARITGIEVAR